MKHILKGKHKNDEWQDMDSIIANPSEAEPKKISLLKEYQDAFGRSWMFKWEIE